MSHGKPYVIFKTKSSNKCPTIQGNVVNLCFTMLLEDISNESPRGRIPSCHKHCGDWVSLYPDIVLVRDGHVSFNLLTRWWLARKRDLDSEWWVVTVKNNHQCQSAVWIIAWTVLLPCIYEAQRQGPALHWPAPVCNVFIISVMILSYFPSHVQCQTGCMPSFITHQQTVLHSPLPSQTEHKT